MKADILEATDLGALLDRELPKCKTLHIASAFVRKSGINVIERHIESLLSAGISAHFLVGLDFNITDGNSLRRLLKWRNDYPKQLKFACYSDPAISRNPTFHPKMYALRSTPKTVKVIVGSSNLTGGGLNGNIELNVMLTGSVEEIEDTGVFRRFSQWFWADSSFVPTEDYIGEYEMLRKRISKRSRSIIKTKSVMKSIDRLRRSERKLVLKPADVDELPGWTKAVYENLPGGEFTTSKVYEKSDVFRQLYPRNTEIEAQIRKQLQKLRDVGLLKHIAWGKWERI